MALADLLQIAEKAFKKRFDADVPFILAKDEKPVNGLVIDTPLLEYILDRRYLPFGRFYLAYGKRGSAKTSFFYEMAKIFQRINGDVVWLETERAADLDYAKKQGVDLTRMSIIHPESLEQALTIGEDMVRNMPKAYPNGDTPVLICLDSIAGSVTEYEQEQKHTIMDTTPGQHARLLSRWYREMEGPLANEKCIFLCLNQQKVNIGGFSFGSEEPEAMIGGNAPLFHSTYQFKFERTKDLTAEDEHGAERKIGAKIRVTCKRNKLGRDGNKQRIEVDLYEQGGMDMWGPLVRKLAEDYTALVGGSGTGWYTWKIENTPYIDPKTNEEKMISTEDTFRENDLAAIIRNSTAAKELIRTVFGLPEMPSLEVLNEVEKERLAKRKKRSSKSEDKESKAL